MNAVSSRVNYRCRYKNHQFFLHRIILRLTSKQPANQWQIVYYRHFFLDGLSGRSNRSAQNQRLVIPQVDNGGYFLSAEFGERHRHCLFFSVNVNDNGIGWFVVSQKFSHGSRCCQIEGVSVSKNARDHVNNRPALDLFCQEQFIARNARRFQRQRVDAGEKRSDFRRAHLGLSCRWW